jgi:hypothetical protein
VPIPSAQREPLGRQNGVVTEWDAWDPGNPENKERTRLLQGELRERLLRWDPIGVAEAPEAQDEYDCLISPLMHMLHDGTSDRRIGKWLLNEMNEHFGLRPDRNRERELARELVHWWQESTATP